MFSNPEIQQQWQLIESLGQAMLEQAGEGQWQTVSSLESRRQQLIRDFFTHRVANENAEVVASAIRHLLQQDEAMLARTLPARDELAQQIKQLSKGKQADQVYRQSAGFGR